MLSEAHLLKKLSKDIVIASKDNYMKNLKFPVMVARNWFFLKQITQLSDLKLPQILELNKKPKFPDPLAKKQIVEVLDGN